MIGTSVIRIFIPVGNFELYLSRAVLFSVWSQRTTSITEKRIFLFYLILFYRKLYQAKMKKKEKTEKKKGRREERRMERVERRVLIETGQSSFHLKAVI
jgi:hypothetical protein